MVLFQNAFWSRPDQGFGNQNSPQQFAAKKPKITPVSSSGVGVVCTPVPACVVCGTVVGAPVVVVVGGGSSRWLGGTSTREKEEKIPTSAVTPCRALESERNPRNHGQQQHSMKQLVPKQTLDPKGMIFLGIAWSKQSYRIQRDLRHQGAAEEGQALAGHQLCHANGRRFRA